MADDSQANNEFSGIRDVLLNSVIRIAPFPMPPSNLKVKFKTIHQWLSHICAADKPGKFIAVYKFGLTESITDNNRTMYMHLVGENSYEEGPNTISHCIEFKPSEMHYKLRKTLYRGSYREQLLEMLTSQLKNFISTEEFVTSFLAEANEIIFKLSGEVLWQKDAAEKGSR